jgi:hypothetical protein
VSANGKSPNGKVDIDKVFATPGLIDAAMARGVREALRRHKALGESIAVWRDGKVVIVPPEEIDLPPSPPDDTPS